MKTDIEIAQAASMLPIHEIADRLGILPEELEPYGRYKAKLSEGIFSRLEGRKDGKLVLVTAIGKAMLHISGLLGRTARVPDIQK